MKKKFLCMLLCAAMLLSLVLTSCSINSGDYETVEGDDDTLTDSDRTPVTLTFWLPAETEIDEETVAMVQGAVNTYLKANFSTAVELKIFSEDAYKAAVDERLAAIEEKAEQDELEAQKKREEERYNRIHGITTEATETVETEETAVETFKDEYGITQEKYPAVSQYQMDIFLITDYTDYVEYIEREALSDLTTTLKGTSKVLNSYIYPHFLTAANYNGATYAVPNNHGLGEFKYLLLNKELIADYNYDADTLAKAVLSAGNLSGVEEFINDILKYEEDDTVTPLLSWTDPAGMYYWSDDGEWSVLASGFGSTPTYNQSSSIGSIFKNNTYKTNFKLMKSFEEAGAISSDPENCENFAVGVIEGTASDVAAYEEDYYIYTYDYPKATQEDLFAGAFAISSYTANFDRAMEVIVALNTVPELRDILQYGVEGTHFEYNEDGTVTRLNDDYTMNILYTGNVYMASLEEGADPNAWEDAKEVNLNSYFTPFSLVPGIRNENNAANFAEIEKLSADLYARLMAISLEDVDEFFKQAETELSENELFAQMTDGSWENGAAYIYSSYYAEHFATEDPDAETPAEE